MCMLLTEDVCAEQITYSILVVLWRSVDKLVKCHNQCMTL